MVAVAAALPPVASRPLVFSFFFLTSVNVVDDDSDVGRVLRDVVDAECDDRRAARAAQNPHGRHAEPLAAAGTAVRHLRVGGGRAADGGRKKSGRR